MPYNTLSHRGLMKLACAKSELLIQMMTIKRFEDHTNDSQRENANNAWNSAVEKYNKDVKEIYNEDRLIEAKGGK